MSEGGAPPFNAPPFVPPFIPPFPARPERLPHWRALIREGRRNSLSVLPRIAYERDLLTTRVLNRDILLCNSPATVQEAFVDKHEVFQRKSPQFRFALVPLIGDSMFASDGALWRERRRLMAPVTHASRMAELLPPATETVAEWRADWARLPAGMPIDVLAAMGQLAAAIICRSLFGRALGRQAAGAVVAGFAEYQAVVDFADPLSLLGLPDWLPRWRGGRITAAIRRMHGVVDGLIAGVLAAGPDEPSLIRAMMQAGEGSMDRAAFRNEAIVLFIAGHETTANLLAWAWYLLSQDPASEARLRAEAAAVLGGRTAALADVPKLVFTRAVVEETLRLYPPVPILSRQALAESSIGGRPVRKGAVVVAIPWLLHRRPSLWEQPDAFLPERFLPGRPRPPRHGYIPFSTGPRICTGQQFGLAEAVIVLASLSQDLRLRLAPGAVVMPVAKLTLRPGDSLPMLLERDAATRIGGEGSRA